MGFDLPGPIDAPTCSCLVQTAGMSFAIIRGWHSYGAFDSAVVSTMSNLWNAGVAHADVYMFPCSSTSAALQVDWLLGNLTANNVRYGMIWLDIEQNPSTGCGWSSDFSANCQYMAALSERLNYHGVNWGVYSTPWEWEQVMGGSACTNPIFNSQVSSQQHAECGESETFHGSIEALVFHRYRVVRSCNLCSLCGMPTQTRRPTSMTGHPSVDGLRECSWAPLAIWTASSTGHHIVMMRAVTPGILNPNHSAHSSFLGASFSLLCFLQARHQAV